MRELGELAKENNHDPTRKKISTTARAALLALAACGMAASAAAQQQPKPPAWAQGRPPEMEKSPLAPHPPKMTVTAPSEIPLDQLKVPPGFKVELWAHGMPGVRMMTLATGERSGPARAPSAGCTR